MTLSSLVYISHIMAGINAGYTTGTGRDEAELRRRNVPGYETANGGHVYKADSEDTKKLQKVGI